MSNLVNHARKELDILSKFHKDPDNRPIVEPFKKELIALVKAFAKKSGASGGSAPYQGMALASTIKELLAFKPLCPITGIDDEWVEVAREKGKPLFQNYRLSCVFKVGEKGKAYYLDAIVWKEGKDQGYTGEAKLPNGNKIYSRQFIKFPFTPKTFYIDVDKNGVVKDLKQLEKVWKLYLKK